MHKDEILISKLDAARRQLETGIILYFNYGDPVSIHTLAAAAYDVLRGINATRGGERMLKDYASVLDKKTAKEFMAHMNRAQNFFKHSDKDPERSIKLHLPTTEIFIIESVRTYMKLMNENPPLMVLYGIWFASKHRNLFDKSPIFEWWIRQLDSVTVPEDRREYFEKFRVFAERMNRQ